jgi:hypothetical protein
MAKGEILRGPESAGAVLPNPTHSREAGIEVFNAKRAKFAKRLCHPDFLASLALLAFAFCF